MRLLGGRRGIRALTAVVAVGVVGALAGCGPAEAGSAAIVADSAIDQGRLEQVTTNYLDSLDAKQRAAATGNLQTVQSRILTELVLERLVGDAADQAGVQISDAQVSEQVQQAVAGSGDQLDTQLAQAFLTRDRLPDLLRVNLQVYAIGRKGAPAGITDPQAAQRAIAYISDPARQLPVRVNPRYGSWAGISIQPGNGSLSKVGTQQVSTGDTAATGAPDTGGQGGS